MKVYAMFQYDKYEGDTLMKLYLNFPDFKDLSAFRNIYSDEGLSRDEIYKLLNNHTTGHSVEGYKIEPFEVEEN